MPCLSRLVLPMASLVRSVARSLTLVGFFLLLSVPVHVPGLVLIPFLSFSLSLAPSGGGVIIFDGLL